MRPRFPPVREKKAREEKEKKCEKKERKEKSVFRLSPVSFPRKLKGKRGEPVATNSLLGWLLCETHEKNTSVNVNSVHNMRVHTETIPEKFVQEDIHNIKKNVFEDFNEIKKLENNKSIDEFKNNLLFEEGRYSTKLPFKEFHDVLPDN